MRIPAAMGLALALLLAAGPGSRAQTRGAELAERLGCLACHALKRPEARAAAAFDGIGTRLTAAELALSIAYPRRRHPGAKMPSYAYLPPAEQAALVEFLQSFK